MKSVIRKAVADEAQLLSDIAFKSKSYWKYSPEFMDACKQELSVSEEKINADGSMYMVYEYENEILGFYAIEKLGNEEAEMEALFVKPEYIGKGIGRALMSHALEYVKAVGFTSLKIQSDPNAELFYISAGAKLIGKQKSESIKGRYLPLLSIELEEA